MGEEGKIRMSIFFERRDASLRTLLKENNIKSIVLKTFLNVVLYSALFNNGYGLKLFCFIYLSSHSFSCTVLEMSFFTSVLPERL